MVYLTLKRKVHYACRILAGEGVLQKNVHGHTANVEIALAVVDDKDVDLGWLAEILGVLNYSLVLQANDVLVDLLPNMKKVLLEKPPTAMAICDWLAESMVSACMEANANLSEAERNHVSLQGITFDDGTGTCYTNTGDI